MNGHLINNCGAGVAVGDVVTATHWPVVHSARLVAS